MEINNLFYRSISGIGVELSGIKPDRQCDIERTILQASSLIDSGDRRILGLILSWIKVHGNIVCVGKLKRIHEIELIGDPQVISGLAFYAISEGHHEWKKLNKNEIRAYLESALKKKITPERLELERKVLVALKLIPKDYKYQEELLNLYTDQVGGYYDPELEYFGTASWIPENMQVPIAFHELTHALQDQHYDLDSFTDAKLTTDDLLARSALAEGDASLAMLLVGKIRSEQGKDLTDSEIKSFSESTVKGSLESGKFTKTPMAITAQLVFPYAKGTEYVFNLFKEGKWKAVNAKYKTPPLGTSEIFGFKKEVLSEKEKSDLTCKSLTENGEIIYEDTLGALYLGFILGENPLSGSLKDRWAGDRLCVVRNGNEESLIWGVRLKREVDKKAVERELEKKLEKGKVIVSDSGLVLVDIHL